MSFNTGFSRGIVLMLACCAFANFACSQNLEELEKRNGFKDIKLGTPVDSIKGLIPEKEFKERNEFPAMLYRVENEAYARIGEVKVSRVELKSYKGTIYEIGVWTDKDPRLMKALESLYGRADFDMKNETYFWKTENIVLKFRSDGKSKLALTYISPPVHKSMKSDKDKKVDDIANDF
ncbi:hypothetical protein WBG78_29800 [Chryseolinea sp. T2]|uniref:hypothetical protein n=1 Tax=Chryseolinea sp. T2 TaxID=3129255 RepID=UPI0030778426